MTTHKKLQIGLWVGLALGSFAPTVGRAQSCDPEYSNSWTGGGPDVFWSTTANWSILPARSPAECDHVFFTIPATTVMDLPDTPEFEFGRKILSFSVSSLADLSGSVLDFDNPTAERRLYSVGDFVRGAADYSNDYVVELCGGDAVYVGDPLNDDAPPTGHTLGLSWDIVGDATVAAEVHVRDYVGCGKWDVTTARVGVGYRWNGDDQVWEWIKGAGAIQGKLACNSEAGKAPEENRWTSRGELELHAKQGYALGPWELIEEVDAYSNMAFDLFFLEYLRAEGMLIRATDQSVLTVGTYYHRTNPPVSEGLRLAGSLTLESRSPTLAGPRALVEKFVAEPFKTLTLDGGAQFEVGRDAVPHPVEELRDSPVAAEFGTNSSLRYGVAAETTPAIPPTFIVRSQNDDARQPVLHFAPDSYITSRQAFATNDDQEMRLETEVHFSIETEVHREPGRQWHTGGVDLVTLGTLVNPGCEEEEVPTCPGLHWCPLNLEVLSPDSGSVWFRDVPEPRCIKYWRNLDVQGEEPAVANVRLVDDFDNYTPTHTACPREVLYVVGSEGNGNVTVSQAYALILNEYPLYFSGELTRDGFDDAVCGEGATQLTMSDYGDFDGDCDIDNDDLAMWSSFNPPPYDQPRDTPFPYFDYDGDCKVGSTDWYEFNDRLVNGHEFLPGCAARARAPKGDRTFQAGDVIFVPANEMHQFVNNTNQPCTFICLIPAQQVCAR